MRAGHAHRQAARQRQGQASHAGRRRPGGKGPDGTAAGSARDPDEQRSSRPRRTVAELLDTATASRLQREQQAAATAAAQQALREQQRAAARQRRLDELAQDPETAWADAERLISTRLPAQYEAAVTLPRDLQELAQREDQARAFARRFAALREAHLRKPSLIARFTGLGSRSERISWAHALSGLRA